MAGPPDDPTRRLTPAPPPTPPPGGPTEYAVAEGDPALSRAAILEDLRSLKRWMALLGVLSVAALAIGLYTLLADDEEDDGPRGASVSSVRSLDERVDRLEDDVEDAASDESVSRLRSQQEELEERVGQVSERAQNAQDDDATEQLRNDVAELEQRLEDLEAQGGDGGTTTTP